MAIDHFIPTVWAEALNEELGKKYVAVANCNRDYEGDIKEMGSQVKICGVAPVRVFQYSRNYYLDTPDSLTDTSKTLEISRATAFNFFIDDIDRVQSAPGLMNVAMRSAADALADDADTYIFSLYRELLEMGQCVTNEAVTPENIIDTIIAAREKLYEGNVSDASEIVLEVSPAVASVILKAKILYGTSDNATTLSNGYIGNFCGCSVYVSRNICYNEAFYCFMRTKRAITYADQLNEVSAYRPEDHFADAIKGLHLYGAAIVYPKEAVVLSLTVPGYEM